MPKRPPSPCTEPGCPRLVPSPGRCLEHKRQADKQAKRAQPWRKLYDDPRWPPLSARVRAEEPLCRFGCGRRSVLVDHIETVRERPDLAFVRANLRALCQSCHSSRTSRDNPSR